MYSNKISLLEGDAFNIPFKNGFFDLVFTCCVLIHINLNDLPDAMDEIYRVSKEYILSIEYYSEEETSIKYRGNEDLLWKRNFSKHFLQRYPDLVLVSEGYFDKSDGFDNSNWWLFKKE